VTASVFEDYLHNLDSKLKKTALVLDNCPSQLLNAHGVSDVRHIKIHTIELLVPDASSYDIEIAIAMLIMYKRPYSEQILAELFLSRR
jgi:hypothetical protein